MGCFSSKQADHVEVPRVAKPTEEAVRSPGVSATVQPVQEEPVAAPADVALTTQAPLNDIPSAPHTSGLPSVLTETDSKPPSTPEPASTAESAGEQAVPAILETVPSQNSIALAGPTPSEAIDIDTILQDLQEGDEEEDNAEEEKEEEVLGDEEQEFLANTALSDDEGTEGADEDGAEDPIFDPDVIDDLEEDLRREMAAGIPSSEHEPGVSINQIAAGSEERDSDADVLFDPDLLSSLEEDLRGSTPNMWERRQKDWTRSPLADLAANVAPVQHELAMDATASLQTTGSSDKPFEESAPSGVVAADLEAAPAAAGVPGAQQGTNRTSASTAQQDEQGQSPGQTSARENTAESTGAEGTMESEGSRQEGREAPSSNSSAVASVGSKAASKHYQRVLSYKLAIGEVSSNEGKEASVAEVVKDAAAISPGVVARLRQNLLEKQQQEQRSDADADGGASTNAVQFQNTTETLNSTAASARNTQGLPSHDTSSSVLDGTREGSSATAAEEPAKATTITDSVSTELHTEADPLAVENLEGGAGKTINGPEPEETQEAFEDASELLSATNEVDSASKVKALSEAGRMLFSAYEERCPPGGEDAVILYTTSVRAIRKTSDDCARLRTILKGLRVIFEERDVSNPEVKAELGHLMGAGVATIPPQLFIRGHYIGDGEAVVAMHEDHYLEELLEGIPRDGEALPRVCVHCQGTKKVVCRLCSGNHKVVGTEGLEACGSCDEHGMVACPFC